MVVRSGGFPVLALTSSGNSGGKEDSTNTQRNPEDTRRTIDLDLRLAKR